MPDRKSPLKIFVYGTLKRGGRNHAAYCRGVLSVEAARITGRLYHLPAGYPMLVVPSSSLLAVGTNDYLRDADRLTDPDLPPTVSSPAADGWLAILGELLHFNDPATRLPALDQLEDFRPGAAGLYLRVLVRLLEPAGAIAWTYVAPDGSLPPGARECGSVW